MGTPQLEETEKGGQCNGQVTSLGQAGGEKNKKICVLVDSMQIRE